MRLPSDFPDPSKFYRNFPQPCPQHMTEKEMRIELFDMKATQIRTLAHEFSKVRIRNIDKFQSCPHEWHTGAIIRTEFARDILVSLVEDGEDDIGRAGLSPHINPCVQVIVRYETETEYPFMPYEERNILELMIQFMKEGADTGGYSISSYKVFAACPTCNRATVKLNDDPNEKLTVTCDSQVCSGRKVTFHIARNA